MTLRALGSLRVEADLIDAVDDMYYLTCNELVTMPGDARLRIKRRRTERERLQAQYPPDVIDGTWAPVPHNALGPGGEPSGGEGSAEQLAQGERGSASLSGSTGAWDRISALTSSSTSQMLTFIPASTRLSPSSQNATNSRLATSPRTPRARSWGRGRRTPCRGRIDR